jgi:hypothetical protein
LRVDAILIDGARVLERFFDFLFRDLVELYAKRLGQLEQLREMPSDGFALTIGVGREIDARGLLDRGAQLFDDRALALDRDVRRREAVVDVDPEPALWKIAEVAYGREHMVV